MTATPKLQSTRDYDKFELHPINRDVRPDELHKSMKRYGFLPQYPVHCVENGNGKLKIKSGHHRFSVARELGLPVYYILADDGDIGIHELERSNNAWTLADFLTSYVRDGRGYYVEVQQFHRRTGIPLSLCIGMLGGRSEDRGNFSPRFKAGAFRVTQEGREHAAAVARMVEIATEAGSDFAQTSPFVGAISKVLQVEELDREELARRLDKWNERLTKQRSQHDYIQNLEEVYNYMSKEARLPLTFLADAAARARNPINKEA